MKFYLTNIILTFYYLTSYVVSSSYPNSDSPISNQPLLLRPTVNQCTVTIIDTNGFDNYGEVIVQPFSIPSDCPSTWSKIILDVNFSVQGVQYDRFGAIWIGNIEVLRTTTPEPTADGIQWFIEKDITIYGSYLKSGNLSTYMSIPNVVDSTYTGVIYATVTLTFYEADDNNPEMRYPLVYPLTNATSNVVFSSMSLTSNQSFTYPINLPNSLSSPGLKEIYAEIYASAHGCEEFYYTNLPSEVASDYGICGGGVYREVQIFIDGNFAGAVQPFPVLYTGGVNPFLWRPLTGIMSFDIPAHRLDISPFLGMLLDGQSHTLTVTVFQNDDQGYWYVDTSLLAYPATADELDEAIISGGIVAVEDSNPMVTVQRKLSSTHWEMSSMIKSHFRARRSPNLFVASIQTLEGSKDTPTVLDDASISFNTTGTHSYTISSTLQTRGGSVKKYSVSSTIEVQNVNALIGEYLATTTQSVTQTTSVKTTTGEGTEMETITTANYPMALESYYKQDSTSFQLQATMLYDYSRSKSWTTRVVNPLSNEAVRSMDEYSYAVSWSNHMVSNATYNRTDDHTTAYIELGRSANQFQIKSSDVAPTNSKDHATSTVDGVTCFIRNMLSYNGDILLDKASSSPLDSSNPSSTSSCSFPTGISFCGYDLCGDFETIGMQKQLLKVAKNLKGSPDHAMVNTKDWVKQHVATVENKRSEIPETVVSRRAGKSSGFEETVRLIH